MLSHPAEAIRVGEFIQLGIAIYEHHSKGARQSYLN